MAKSRKKHLDYFPLDVHLNEKFELLEAEFGLTGFGVIIKLFQRIYGGDGYYCKWNEEVALLFAKGINVGCNVVSEIVNAAVRRGIFDEAMFNSYGILTSAGIQSRYIDVVKRLNRPQIEIEEAFRLVSHTKNAEPSQENLKISQENPKNSQENAQKKRKENKSNKIKGNEIKNKEKETYGKYSRVTLTSDEYASLIDDYADDTDAIIDYLDKKMEANGYKYNNCYLKIKEWAAEAYLNEVKPVLAEKAKDETFKKILEETRVKLSEDDKKEYLKKYGKYVPQKQEE